MYERGETKRVGSMRKMFVRGSERERFLGGTKRMDKEERKNGRKVPYVIRI